MCIAACMAGPRISTSCSERDVGASGTTNSREGACTTSQHRGSSSPSTAEVPPPERMR
eukprot:CAMPEP_0177400118 /NCGR_PEP_ID=MMETSP0368-20130122/58901_1 /TAXON_ID=447022 ORGANISM="Scrippsiella hangoei-like, Strain SHHI-4" /NCGR_SAMPLE_ID=MMETSP0368 /ASSEMBLY_ACC=CAM_ASM_000363 /LENGTH=57 /DNA_ID=CAMNT_0018867521 /DNA_START=228 /DNA_END=397 /DNA_ORIENTATION=+